MYLKLKSIVKTGKVLKNEDLKKHTSFKVGGLAKLFVLPNNIQELLEVLDYLKLKNIKYYILGNGTNVVFNSSGYNGVIISLKNLNDVRKYDGYVQAYSGASISKVCVIYKLHNLGGLELAYGLPGSVGAGVKMNAGAYGFEIKDVVMGVLALVNGKIDYFKPSECGFGYRKSNFSNGIILSVDLKYTNGCDEKLMQEVMEKRKTSQPLELPSAGSVFKRKDGVIVSKLIDELGLKGYRVGGAEVSTKHAGFIVNVGNATSSDILSVVNHVKSVVKDKTGLELETEIEFVD